MQAIVFADRLGAELAPLCEHLCPAMLPIANRPLLRHTLDDLATSGIDEVLLVVSENVFQIRETFDDGRLWGLEIHYLLSRGEERPTRVIQRFANRLKAPFVVARGDVLRTGMCTSLLKIADSVPGNCVHAMHDGRNAGLALVREWPVDVDHLGWPLGNPPASKGACLELGLGRFARIDSLEDLYHSAMSLVQDPEAWPQPPGIEIEPGFRVDRLSAVKAHNRTDGTVLIGANCWLHPESRLAGTAIVGDDCYIDRGATITRSIVMPGTYVGEDLEVNNAIVSGEHLIRIDRGTHIRLAEGRLLSPVRRETEAMLEHWPQRTLAMLLLAASAPLWPLALLLSSLRNPRRPLRETRVAVNDAGPGMQVSRIYLFDTPVPLLRKLPLLLLVIRGDLALFGASSILVEPIVPLRGGSPRLGLLGPELLWLPRGVPAEEIRLAEISFMAETGIRGFLTKLALAARALFSRRAWVSDTAAQNEL